jgi:hypothetical protein
MSLGKLRKPGGARLLEDDEDLYEGYNTSAAEAFTIAKTAYGGGGGFGAPSVGVGLIICFV